MNILCIVFSYPNLIIIPNLKVNYVLREAGRGILGTGIGLFINWENGSGLAGTRIREWKNKLGLGLLDSLILGISLFFVIGIGIFDQFSVGFGIRSFPSGRSTLNLSKFHHAKGVFLKVRLRIVFGLGSEDQDVAIASISSL